MGTNRVLAQLASKLRRTVKPCRELHNRPYGSSVKTANHRRTRRRTDSERFLERCMVTAPGINTGIVALNLGQALPTRIRLRFLSKTERFPRSVHRKRPCCRAAAVASEQYNIATIWHVPPGQVGHQQADNFTAPRQVLSLSLQHKIN